MDDSKIKAIRKMPEGSSIFELWIGILCLAMKSGRPGCVEIGDGIPFNPETLSNHFNISYVTVTLALRTFEQFKMIELLQDGTIFIKNFEKHQQLDKIRGNLEKTRKRVEKYRNKQKLLSEGVTVTPPLRNGIDKDVHKEVDKKKKQKKTPVNFHSLISEFPLLNNDKFNAAYSEWESYSKENHKQLASGTVIKAQLKFLSEQPDPIACIESSIRNGYKGLFEVKVDNPKSKQSESVPDKKAARIARNMKALNALVERTSR